MEKNKDFTLIIHGPLTIYTMFTLYRYATQYNIVIVAPRPVTKNNIISEIQTLSALPDTNISLILYGNILKDTHNNRQNKYLHFVSVVTGLGLTTTEYAIKMRADEFYSNLNGFQEAVLRHPTRITTNDVFFRNHKMPLHPSDHLMGGKVDNLLKVFEYARALVEVPESDLKDEFFNMLRESVLFKTHKFISAEQYIGVAATKTLIHEEVNVEKYVDYMKEMFYIVPCEELGVYRVCFNSAARKDVNEPLEYFDNSYYNKDTDINDINLYGTHEN
jgi:CRISPR/Cas system CMR-associated protein Cmr3 (group 5 of RAMP superfamily)